MNVSTSGFYVRLRGDESPRKLRDKIHTQHIKEIFNKYRGIYGAHRIRAELVTERNIHMSRRKISSQMVQCGLISPTHRINWINTTDSKHNPLTSDNLLKRQIN